MMELSFEIPSLLVAMINEPMYIVMWAAFGMFFFSVGLALIFAGVDKLLNINLFKRILEIIIPALVLTWLVGFVVMIIFLFIGINGAKMLLIWFSMFVVFLIFSIVEQRAISKYFASYIKK